MTATSQTTARPTNPPPPEAGGSQTQRLYRELMSAAYPELRQRAEAGEEDVCRWLERFLALGRQLGVPVNDLTRDRLAAMTAAASALVEEALTTRRIPTA